MVRQSGVWGFQLFLQGNVSTTVSCSGSVLGLSSQGLPGHWRHCLLQSPPMENSPSTFFVRPQFGQLRAGAITSSRVPQELSLL